jgi:hypothetical protein
VKENLNKAVQSKKLASCWNIQSFTNWKMYTFANYNNIENVWDVSIIVNRTWTCCDISKYLKEKRLLDASSLFMFESKGVQEFVWKNSHVFDEVDNVLLQYLNFCVIVTSWRASWCYNIDFPLSASWINGLCLVINKVFGKGLNGSASFSQSSVIIVVVFTLIMRAHHSLS